MLYIVLSFLAISLLLYVVLAGADFGAGIVELFSSKKNQEQTKKTIYRVMGPVWEANHIWIIIMVVILWVAFPKFYNILVIYLHIPLTLTLLGITLRGIAFVFRHYDAYIDKSQIIYDWMFRVSSLVTPIFLGMTFGATISGKLIITEDYTNFSFNQLYIIPWLNTFSILVGLFFAGLCAFLSSILLIGEADTTNTNIYLRKSKIATLTLIVLGFIVLCYGFFNEIQFVTTFINNPYTISLIILSAILIYPLLLSIKKAKQILSRALAGLQVFFILTAALITHYPNLIITNKNKLSLLDGMAPEVTIDILGISLIIGGCLIIPGLFHLLKSFKMIKILES